MKIIDLRAERIRRLQPPKVTRKEEAAGRLRQADANPAWERDSQHGTEQADGDKDGICR